MLEYVITEDKFLEEFHGTGLDMDGDVAYMTKDGVSSILTHLFGEDSRLESDKDKDILIKSVGPKVVGKYFVILKPDASETSYTTEMKHRFSQMKTIKRLVEKRAKLFKDDSMVPPTEFYTIEEISELITALMAFQKGISKFERGKKGLDEVFDEGCDVITTILIQFYSHGIDLDNLSPSIIYKLQRACDRYEDHKEI